MKKIVIIGAGPAGLTAGIELQAAGIQDITILEASDQVGGISKTIKHQGNRIDIGGHRFFSKSDWVMNWWTNILPVQQSNDDSPLNLRYQGQTREYTTEQRAANDTSVTTVATAATAADSTIGTTTNAAAEADAVMLVRNRLSRIYYNRQFFDYPLKLNITTLRKLGLIKTIKFGFSYMYARLRPVKPEKSLEDFLTNRFGRLLYLQFFKEYTEKVWGVSCSEISAEWGAQRIKSLSITKALWHALKSALGLSGGKAAQTSLIEHFIYPKYGPGQMWETAAQKFVANGGRLEMHCKVTALQMTSSHVTRVSYVDAQGSAQQLDCTQAISTMPIKDLIAASKEHWSPAVIDTAKNLAYRDFMTVGLLYNAADLPHQLLDNWIYIQEPGVQVGRVQVFNNWSPYMVADSGKVWLGLEFFCQETDSLWTMSDDDMKVLAQQEMVQIGLVSVPKALDAVVIRVPKAYPGYFGEAYKNFEKLRTALDSIDNLFLIGRNGMHRYNNQDHSMLTAKEAVHQIVTGKIDKKRIWDVNIGDDYHEEVQK